MRAIVSGAVFKAPLEKTSAAGRSYVLATIVEKIGDKKRWIKAFIFNEAACAEVRRLGDGDPIAVAGEIDADVYAPDGGEPRVNWRVTVDAVLSARKPTKAKANGESFKPRAKRGVSAASIASKSWAAPAVGGARDDSIPF
jgi:single-stranded DNA-binding protein